ncbi:unnamed protein product, partial [Medioppia subpectinata]
GLNPVTAKQLLSTCGPNIVTTKIATGEWIRLMKNVFHWFNSLLWIGSLLCFITYITESISASEDPVPDNLYLGCVLAGCVLISSSFSYYQEAKSANIFVTFRELIPRYVTVIRAASKLRCPATELVVGDLIEITAGDKVPADIRIIKSHELKCVNHLLTGNYESFVRSDKCSNTNPFSTENLVFFSTNCVEGTGLGIVIRTGNQTLMSGLLSHFYKTHTSKKLSKSLLDKHIEVFIRIITAVSLVFSLLLSITSYMIGYSWLSAIIFMIALFVAQIPEGLFPTLTVLLSLAAKRMTSKNCLVTNFETVETLESYGCIAYKRMTSKNCLVTNFETVETLGLTSIIVTNKTGIITQNRMVVSHIWANNSIIDSENFYRHSDGRTEDLGSVALKAFIRIGCLCNAAEFSAAQARLSPLKREAIGNSTDVAILKYMEVIVGCVEGYRLNYPKVLHIKRMTSKNCLVTNFETVETLGLTSIIVTNKTGIITQNRMVVSHMWANNSIIDSENFYRHSDGRTEDLGSVALKAFIRIGCLCNAAEFSAAQARLSPLKREAIGNSTDVAILKYMEVIVGCVEGYRLNYPKVLHIPFNSNARHSLTINRFSKGFWLCMKGEPELIIDKCSSILTMDRVIPFDNEYKIYFKQILDELGSFGERVIAFCDQYLPYTEYPVHYSFNSGLKNYPTNGLRFVGLISLLNPPRASVPEAVHKCKSAGIKIVMVTGDHAITAKAIASAVGIISDNKQTTSKIAKSVYKHKDIKRLLKSSVIAGKDVQDLSDRELCQLVKSNDNLVFARINPKQKSRVINCLKSKKSVIAVTRDGVHGSTLVENADINIAMGITGTDISKQSADVILLDDDFASIVSGIEEGRVIFDNLKKSICYTLSSKTPIICPFLLYLLADIPLPLGSITILCIDLICDMIPAISLAYELPEYDIMNYKLRDPMANKLVHQKLLYLSYFQLGFFELFGGLFTYAIIMIENGFNLSYLFGLRKYWDSIGVNDLMDSYGQEWSNTYNDRKTLEYTCHTAFFASVVITKWSALICCKTRRISILRQKMTNDVLTFSLFFELGLAVFLSYCPGLDNSTKKNDVLTFSLFFELGLAVFLSYCPGLDRGIFFWWFCSIPFAVLMIIYDELRRYLIRQYPNGWVEIESFY